MKKSLKIFNIIVAVLALIASSIAILTIAKDIISAILNKSFAGLSFLNLLVLIISLPFAITELKNGIDIIKITKKDAINDALKPIIGLVNSIVGVFAALASREIVRLLQYAIINQSTFDLAEASPLIFGFIIVILSRTTTSLLKRNSYGKMAFFSIFFSLISFVYLCTINLFSNVSIPDLIQNVANLLVVLLVFVYSILAAIYYIQNKDDIDVYDIDSKDVEVIKQVSSDKQKIRVFQQRKGKGSVIAIVFYTLSFVFYLAFTISYFINLMGGDFIIDFASMNSSSSLSTLDYLYAFSLLLTIPYLIVAAVGIYTKNSLYYQNTIMMASSITVVWLQSATSSIGLLLKASDALLPMGANMDTTTYVIIKMVLSYLPVLIIFVLLIVARFQFNKLNDSIKNGETYYGSIKRAKTFTILYFISSLLLLAGPIFELITTGTSNNISSLILFLTFMLMLLVAVSIHSKCPLEESYVTHKKIVTKLDKVIDVVDENEEIAVAIPVDENENDQV